MVMAAVAKQNIGYQCMAMSCWPAKRSLCYLRGKRKIVCMYGLVDMRISYHGS